MTITAQPTDKARESGGWVVRHWRELLGLSQLEAGRLAGVSRDQVGRIERGEVGPVTAATVRLAVALGEEAADRQMRRSAESGAVS
jgi:transcriptional regulator with XRE-family HTH domain